jgi:hypothetical protein
MSTPTGGKASSGCHSFGAHSSPGPPRLSVSPLDLPTIAAMAERLGEDAELLKTSLARVRLRRQVSRAERLPNLGGNPRASTW